MVSRNIPCLPPLSVARSEVTFRIDLKVASYRIDLAVIPGALSCLLVYSFLRTRSGIIRMFSLDPYSL